MFNLTSLAVLLALPAIAAALVAVAVLLGLATRRGGATGVTESTRVTAARTGGLLTGAVTAAVVAGSDADVLALGRGAMLAPVALGLGVLLGVILGETVARSQPVSGVRTADLTPRRVVDYLPGRLTALVGLLVVLTVLTLAATSATASSDDLGRGGRQLARACPAGSPQGPLAASLSPYPGSYYSLPLAAGLLVTLALAALAVRRVVLRPRGTSGASRGDEVLRKRSAAAVVAGLGIAVAIPLTGVAATAASALASHPCPAAGWRELSILLLAVVVLTLVASLWCLVALLTPAAVVAESSPGSGR